MVLTTLAASRTGAAQTPQALTSGYHLAWTVGAIMAGGSVAIAAIAFRQPGGAGGRGQSGDRPAGNQAVGATGNGGRRRDEQSAGR